MVGPGAKREAVAHLRSALAISERRACIIVAADRTMIRYRSRRPPESELRARLRELANARRRFGYRRLFILLRREGEPSGINRIYRLYREEGLTVRKRRARRRAVGTRTPIMVEARVNARWSLDFVHDQLAAGRRFRILNVVDDVTRECLAAIPDTSISGKRVARELTAVIARRGKPQMIVSDNGSEFTSNAILSWAGEERIEWHYIARRQADAERLHRVLQRADARRASQRDLILRSRPGPAAHRRLGRRLQHCKAALLAWLPNASGLCRPTDRADRRNNRRGSNRRWMKVQWQVNFSPQVALSGADISGPLAETHATASQNWGR